MIPVMWNQARRKNKDSHAYMSIMKSMLKLIYFIPAASHAIGNKNIRVRDSVFLGVTDEYDRCPDDEPFKRSVDNGTF